MPHKKSTKEFCDTSTAGIARHEKYRCWASVFLEPKIASCRADALWLGGGLSSVGWSGINQSWAPNTRNHLQWKSITWHCLGRSQRVVCTGGSFRKGVRVHIGVSGGGFWGRVQPFRWVVGVVLLWKWGKSWGGGLGTGKGTGKSMRARWSKLPFSKLPFPESRGYYRQQIRYCPPSLLGQSSMNCSYHPFQNHY